MATTCSGVKWSMLCPADAARRWGLDGHPSDERKQPPGQVCQSPKGLDSWGAEDAGGENWKAENSSLLKCYAHIGPQFEFKLISITDIWLGTECYLSYWFWRRDLLNEGYTILNWFTELDTKRLFSNGAPVVWDTLWGTKQYDINYREHIPVQMICKCVGCLLITDT